MENVKPPTATGLSQALTTQIDRGLDSSGPQVTFAHRAFVNLPIQEGQEGSAALRLRRAHVMRYGLPLLCPQGTVAIHVMGQTGGYGMDLLSEWLIKRTYVISTNATDPLCVDPIIPEATKALIQCQFRVEVLAFEHGQFQAFLHATWTVAEENSIDKRSWYDVVIGDDVVLHKACVIPTLSTLTEFQDRDLGETGEFLKTWPCYEFCKGIFNGSVITQISCRSSAPGSQTVDPMASDQLQEGRSEEGEGVWFDPTERLTLGEIYPHMRIHLQIRGDWTNCSLGREIAAASFEAEVKLIHHLSSGMTEFFQLNEAFDLAEIGFDCGFYSTSLIPKRLATGFWEIRHRGRLVATFDAPPPIPSFRDMTLTCS